MSLIALIKDRWGFGRFTRAQHEQAYLLAKGHPPKPAEAISDDVRERLIFLVEYFAERTCPHAQENRSAE